MKPINNNQKVLRRIEDSVKEVKQNPTTSKFFKFSMPDLKSVYDQGNQAMILNNMRKICDSDEMANFIQTSNYGPYIPELWPVVVAWYPEFPLKDLISVQSMDRPLAYMAFTSLKAGTNKADTVAGEMVETATGLRKIHGSYPTGEIHGEELTAEHLQYDNTEKTDTGALAYFPLTLAGDYSEMYAVNITSTDSDLNGKWVFGSVTGNTITFVKSGVEDQPDEVGVTMDTQTGALVIKEKSTASATTVSLASVYYVWDIQFSDKETIPSIVEDIELLTAEAKPRALGLRWSIFSEYVKKSQFGTNIRVDVTKRCLSLMYQFQTRYILDRMYNFSTVTEQEISMPTGNITVEAKVQEVLETLNKGAAQIIAENTGRMYGNRLVVGRDFRSWLESLPNIYWEQDPKGDPGYESPRKLGTFGPYEVFYDPHQANDKGFMTYRGEFWADAAYYLGEFMPVVPTDAVTLGTDVRSAFCSMEAHKYHKPNAVVPLKFTTA